MNPQLDKVLSYFYQYNYIETSSFSQSIISFLKDEKELSKEKFIEYWTIIEDFIIKELNNVNVELVKLSIFLSVEKVKDISYLNFKKLLEDKNLIIGLRKIRNEYLKVNLNKLKSLLQEIYKYDNTLNITNMLLADALMCHGNSVKKTATYIKELNKIKEIDITHDTFLSNVKLDKIKRKNIEKIEVLLNLELQDIACNNGFTLIENANKNYFMWESLMLLNHSAKTLDTEFEQKILTICEYSFKDFSRPSKDKMIEIVNAKLEKAKVAKSKLFWLKVSFYLTDWETKEIVVKKVRKI